MSKKLSLSLAAVCVAALTSGMANAATEIGKGTLTMNGTISTTTCTVTPSTTSVTFPALTPAVIVAASANQDVATQPLSLNFKDCGVLGNSIEVAMTRTDMPPATSSTAWFGGFTYASGADSTKSPISFRVKNPANKYLQVDGVIGVNNTIDLTAITDKSAFSLPFEVVVTRVQATNSVNDYVGNYTGSAQYAIAYP